MSTTGGVSVTVRYTTGFSCPVRADVAYAALEAIRAKNPEKKLLAREVVRAASRKTHPLHAAGFTWDDKKAAQKHRESEARTLIRSVVVVSLGRPDTAPQPVYLHVPVQVGPPKAGYLPAAELMSKTDYREGVLVEAGAQLRGWLRRYGSVAGMADAAALVEQAARAAEAAAPPPRA